MVVIVVCFIRYAFGDFDQKDIFWKNTKARWQCYMAYFSSEPILGSRVVSDAMNRR